MTPENDNSLRRMILGLTAFVLVLAVSVSAYAQDVRVDLPRGGEIASVSDTMSIRWSVEEVGELELVLWNGSTGRWSVLASEIPASNGQWPWIIGDSVRGNLLRIAIVDSTGRILARSPSYFSVRSGGAGAPKVTGRLNVKTTDELSVRIVPNPSHGGFRIDCRDCDGAAIVVTDMLGSICWVGRFDASSPMNIIAPAPGSYRVSLQTTGGRQWSGPVIVF